MLCQAPRCSERADYAVVERDGTRVRICEWHAHFVDELNNNMPESRQVTVEPLEEAG